MISEICINQFCFSKTFLLYLVHGQRLKKFIRIVMASRKSLIENSNLKNLIGFFASYSILPLLKNVIAQLCRTIFMFPKSCSHVNANCAFDYS